MNDELKTELKHLWMAIEALAIDNGVTGTVTYQSIKDSGRDPAEVLNNAGINDALNRFIVEAHARLT